ncbi:hypothetical protein [Zobellia barbeyronii]|uniref:Uncharacterized protein n=1 Tax=Zobellia barbeyronii TaxID=2748009 RepID=A0ABS5WIZ0_9FLAO|nr:hypothetical protein [Zobellia barbeyronii]MBT2163369.1 hypothetical protein [Zobellia barbeyronii]
MKKIFRIILLVFAILAVFMAISAFVLADLRPDEVKDNNQSKEKIAYAKELLDEAVLKQGLDKLNQFSTYEAIGRDYWPGLMGKVGSPYRWENPKIAFRFKVGNFDSQLEVLEGDEKGYVAGIISNDYYEKQHITYHSEVEDNAGIIFTLGALQYFFELADRLSKAPFIRYVGQDELRGQKIEKVFVSWGNETTKDYDHYVLWIGKESGLVEAATFTTRNNPKPAPNFLYGSMQFEDYRNVNGILVPFVMTAQIGEPKDDTNENVHRVTVESFKWDSFPADKLNPIGKN